MKQNVDLYQERFRSEKPFLNSTSLVQMTAVVVVFMALIYGYELWSASGRQQLLHSLRQQHSDGALNLVQLAEQYPPARTDPKLEAETETLTAERDAKTHLLRLLAGQALGNSSGFSEHAAALARQNLDGLWLREIHLRRGGQEMALVGSALEADLVPRLIQQLSDEESFAGADFTSLDLARAESQPGRIDFELRNYQEVEP